MTTRKHTGEPWTSLIALREAQGLSKTALARRAEIGLSHLLILESGQSRPNTATRKRLADALGVAVSAIPLPVPGDGLDAPFTPAQEARIIELIREHAGPPR